MQIIQKTGNMKKVFVINIMRSLTYMDIKYMRFCLCKGNWGTDFIFRKTNFGNSKKLESIGNVFVFIKISCQSKEPPPPFLNNPPI